MPDTTAQIRDLAGKQGTGRDELGNRVSLTHLTTTAHTGRLFSKEEEMEKILYVDLDGVLVDFVGGWMDHYFIMNRKPVTKWNFGEDYGLDRKDFYRSITSLSISFWSNLSPTTWAFKFMDCIKLEMAKNEKIMFLSHAVSEDCRVGKQLWVNKHFPDLGDSLITVSDSKLKSRFANQHSVLIDDKFENCIDFAKNGGRSWLFARPWNRGMACKRSDVVFFPFSTMDQSDNQYTEIYDSFSPNVQRIWHYNSHEYEAVLEPVKIVKQTGLIEAIMKGEI